MSFASTFIGSSTCRIVCDDGQSIGTGFWFAFEDPENPDAIHSMLVTNKHVVEGARIIKLRINIKNANENSMKAIDITIDDGELGFIKHPDPDVDLCVFPTNSVIELLRGKGLHPDIFLFLDTNLNGASTLSPIEDVFMTGYPNGLWDEINNLPITRKGITASSVNMNWNGKHEFMIDMACFGGSSGSPVYIMNEGGYSLGGGLTVGNRLILLGILYAGPQVNVNGTIEVINVPTSSVAVVNSNVMMNLGIVINANKLNDFKSYFFKKLN